MVVVLPNLEEITGKLFSLDALLEDVRLGPRVILVGDPLQWHVDSLRDTYDGNVWVITLQQDIQLKNVETVVIIAESFTDFEQKLGKVEISNDDVVAIVYRLGKLEKKILEYLDKNKLKPKLYTFP